MSKKKIILSAGGTGGHLFPAQVIASELKKSCEVLFVGGGLSKSRYFQRDLFSFEEICCATFSLSKPWKIIQGGKTIFKGLIESRKILREFKPDIVVGFGSFYTLPILIAAIWAKIPIVLHEQNAIPGKVNRLFSRFAKMTAITFPKSAISQARSIRDSKSFTECKRPRRS